ncbi:PAQR family membrane homeostasis protein TrhA [Enterococcus aquimarinus]|uniref:Hemolysin III family channel protein n=1 Tax=Enterococcus aquimarinus TaxID=328396 RepID=A0A1L8QQZ6_9ENTE|nr:hemolysin III family protein [Enterococcus aquimarinus]MCC9272920.1 hemolysin III family protein [Enterococcus aquimarinus]OJG09955.1 hemolysin III family channel protein [Enterococcus aquimarinus]
MEMSKDNRNYLILNEILNAVTHGIALGFSIAGLVVLLVKGAQLGSPVHIVSYAIYGSTMILLFLFSTLFHSLMFTRARTVFQVFDHSSIFLLIAGSYTPFCLISIQGWLGWTLFVFIWLIAIAGIIYKSLTLHQKEPNPKISTMIYIVMGWLCLIAFYPLVQSLGVRGTALLASGGIAYTFGTIFYRLKNVPFMHVVWHLFVMLGAGLIYFSILLYT